MTRLLVHQVECFKFMSVKMQRGRDRRSRWLELFLSPTNDEATKANDPCPTFPQTVTVAGINSSRTLHQRAEHHVRRRQERSTSLASPALERQTPLLRTRTPPPTLPNFTSSSLFILILVLLLLPTSSRAVLAHGDVRWASFSSFEGPNATSGGHQRQLIPVVLPVSTSLNTFYRRLISDVNDHCSQPALDGVDDNHLLTIRNITGPDGIIQPLQFPASCKRYTLVGVNAVDSPQYLQSTRSHTHWPQQAIVAVRAGIQHVPGVAQQLVDMREFLSGTLDDHPAMNYSSRAFSCEETVLDGAPGSTPLVGVAIQSSPQVLLYRVDLALQNNLTAVLPSLIGDPRGILEAFQLLSPSDESMFGYLPYGLSDAQFSAQLYGPVSLPARPTMLDVVELYSSKLAQFLSSSNILRRMRKLVSVPGLMPRYWTTIGAKHVLRKFCRGETMSITISMAALRDFDMSRCPPYALRKEPWTLVNGHDTSGIAVTRDLAADSAAAPFVRAFISAAVRSVGAVQSDPAGSTAVDEKTSEPSLNCDMDAIQNHFEPIVDMYWGGGVMPSEFPLPVLNGLIPTQYGTFNVSSRHQGVQTIAQNLAKHVYQASCQWECHDRRLSDFDSEGFAHTCLSENPINACAAHASAEVWLGEISRGSLDTSSNELASQVFSRLSRHLECFPTPTPSISSSPWLQPPVVVSVSTGSFVIVVALFLTAWFHRVSSRLNELNEVRPIDGLHLEGPLEELWSLILRLDDQDVFSNEDKVILRVFRNRIRDKKMFMPASEGRILENGEDMWFKVLGVSNTDLIDATQAAQESGSTLTHRSFVYASTHVVPFSRSTIRLQGVSHLNMAERENARRPSRALHSFRVQSEQSLSSLVSDDEDEEKPSLNSVPSRFKTTPFLDLMMLEAEDMVVSPPWNSLELLYLRENLFLWDGIDVFQVSEQVGPKSVLPVLLCMSATELGIPGFVDLDLRTFQAFANAVSSHYVASNPYHNALHAADVVHNIATQLHCDAVHSHTSMLDKIAALVAAAVHDVGHTGQTNQFHSHAGTDLGTLYSNGSCLQNYHLAVGFMLMSNPSRDITQHMSRPEVTRFRSLVVDMVLATDPSQSYSTLGRFRMQAGGTVKPPQSRRPSLARLTGSFKASISRIARRRTSISVKEPRPHNSADWVDGSQTGVSLLLQMCLQFCDAGHAGKRWSRHKRWMQKLSEEFFRQGDYEREIGLPVSPLCDRDTVKAAESHEGFFAYLALPTFEAWCEFTGDAVPLGRAKRNHLHWKVNSRSSRKISKLSHVLPYVNCSPPEPETRRLPLSARITPSFTASTSPARSVRG